MFKNKIKIVFFILLVCLPFNFSYGAVLNRSDVSLYKQIFKAHQKGHYITAKSLEKKLSNKILSPYILYDKFFSVKYKTSSREINSFLKKYSYLPIAIDIYELGKRKKIKLKHSKPKDIVFGSRSKACSYVKRDEPINLVLKRSFSHLNAQQKKEALAINKKIYRFIQKGNLNQALHLVEQKRTQKLFKSEDISIAYTAISFSYFLKTDDKKAIYYAKKAIDFNDDIPQPYWTIGLSLWRQGNFDEAAEYFSQVAHHDKSYSILKGAAAFWAARTYLKLGEFNNVTEYLELASNEPRTFYGILALYILGKDIESVLDKTPTNHDDISVKFSHPALNRFYALKQVGFPHLAERELAKLYLEANENDKVILQNIASKKGFKSNLAAITGVSNDTEERFPIPNWEPTGGWKIDKSLVFAFVRQESCFNKTAKSSVGARGLMQIMPQTGKAVSKMIGEPWLPYKMDNISYNLMLGQYYLLYLLDLPAINHNLIFTATAYNAGPGNLIKWKKQMNYENDPLLFIESIPSRETRGFVERIMVNYWIYKSLNGDSLQSLSDIIMGKWPKYSETN